MALRPFVAVVGLVLIPAGIASARLPAPPTTGDAKSGGEAARFIPRSVLFGNPERAGVRVSPDGQRLSWLAPVDGVLNLWVAPVDHPDQAKAVTSDKGRGIRSYNWAYTNKDILYTQDVGGDENWKVFRVNLETGEVKDLTPFSEIKGPDGKPLMLPSGKPMRPAARIQEASPDHPGHVLLALNNRNPQWHDLYRVDIATGAMDLVMQNDEGFAGYVTDNNFNVRFGAKSLPDGGMETQRYVAKDDGKGAWEGFMKVGMEDAQNTSVAGLDRAGTTLYVIESRGRNTSALMAMDLATGKSTLVAEDPRADIAGTLADPKTDRVQAASFNYLRTEWKVLDQSIKPDLDYLATVADGEVNVASRSDDDRVWTVAYLLDDSPVKYYLYRRGEAGKPGKATFLFTNSTKMEGQPFTKMHPVVIKSRDGLDMVCYLSLPKDSYDLKTGQPTPRSPLPMVLNVHGGPWARDRWGLNPEHQWLADRGYAVLSVNYRGSTGFGKNFINAANREWAGKMHDDLIDAVNWAIEHGIADKSKVAIYGGSYGGYSALVGVTFTPEVFACSVDLVGVSNLETFINSIPPYWKPMLGMLTQRVGDVSTEEGRKFLASRSPITFVDRIKRPLLIGQGANDPRVKQAESDQIVEVMKKKGLPVTYVLYPDEGHGFARPENRLSFYAVAEAFLAQHLGGRYQPVGDDFKNSTIKVIEGVEHVPGLSGAIR